MSNCKQPHGHSEHDHGPACGHIAIEHAGHTDYLEHGRLHHPHGDHYDAHVLDVNATNPDQCTGGHSCAAHPPQHVHGPGCGHEPVPHGDHVDYLVDGHLHHPHGDHCDDHGPVRVI